MIGELESNRPPAAARFDERDAPASIGDMDRFAHDDAPAAHLALDFEHADVDPLNERIAMLGSPDLANTLAGPVVDEIRPRVAARLPARQSKAIAEVPRDLGQLRHRQHVAVDVVAELLVN